METNIVTFLRKKDYSLVKELGEGACGKTVLLRDDFMDEMFVCKKFIPKNDKNKKELFNSFIREIKILNKIIHENIVRVYNYYLYPDEYAGYILMEYIDGEDIEEYLAKAPEKINEIFIQTINAFKHLEANNILHRDIRPNNIMVRKDGIVKVIDFGFGKQIKKSDDFDKSVSLNWWCQPPSEFSKMIYNFATEVYFLGKLFEGIIQSNKIESFKYTNLLNNMCQHIPEMRINKFIEVEQQIQGDRFLEIGFSDDEKENYLNFANQISHNIIKIENKAKYQNDLDKIQIDLENIYRCVILEEIIPDCANVINSFINGEYYYSKSGFAVNILRDYIRLIKSSSIDKKRIIISNLNTRLDSIKRYSEETEEELPF
jgi:eukaryotic-like serine/threonine-protein kinase